MDRIPQAPECPDTPAVLPALLQEGLEVLPVGRCICSEGALYRIVCMVFCSNLLIGKICIESGAALFLIEIIQPVN